MNAIKGIKNKNKKITLCGLSINMSSDENDCTASLLYSSLFLLDVHLEIQDILLNILQKSILKSQPEGQRRGGG